jgi:hypothetical protein
MGMKLGLPTLRQKHILRMFENRLLRGIFRPNRNKLQETGENRSELMESSVLYCCFKYYKLIHKKVAVLTD